MDYNTRVVANNPAWTGDTTSIRQDVAAAATPSQLAVPGWARYVILQPVGGTRCKVIPRTAGSALPPVKADPGIEIGAGGSLEIALGPQADIYLEVTNNGDDVDATFFS